MKKSIKTILIIVAALIGVILLADGTFILNEDESAIVERFGRIESVYVKAETPALRTQIENLSGYRVSIHTGTGLKLKVPLIDSVVKYSSKLLTYDTPAQQVIASDKKILFFDNNAQWRIDNPLLFRISVGNVETARERIDYYMYSLIREKVGKLDSTTLISDKATIESMLLELNKQVTAETTKFGVTVLDIRIKRTDFPSENYASIYNRMITERNRIAAQYRSEGEEMAIEMRSKTDREVTVITSEAARASEILKGEGDAEAARIFNEAYGKNPDFFKFYNMLDTYRQTVGEGTTLVIPLNSEFGKYLLNPNAQ